MEPLTYLKNRANENWLICHESHNFTQLAEQLYLELTQPQAENPPKILLAERHPVKFLASFIAATAANCPVFLCNPDWVESEWQQVFNLVQPDLIWGLQEKSITHPLHPLQNPLLISSSIMIPTGGSSGKINFAMHSWETLMASVRGFTEYFQTSTVNSFCVLPLYHVSGLMQFMRSFTTGGRLVILPFKALESGEKCEINPKEFFISLVPTQLQRLLNFDPKWLSQFHTVLLGGAPAWTELLAAARSDRIPLAPTYGMTETASQIVTLKPEDFLNGNNSCGSVLPHAQVTIQNGNGELINSRGTGIITIQADSLALGYYPEIFDKTLKFQVDDLGYFDEGGYLNIVGRNSNKIITGGENVFPSEVEAAILATNLVSDVCTIGLPDPHWGQVVTAIYVPIGETSSEKLERAIADKLSKFKRPKYWLQLEKIPRNNQGKINYQKLEKIAIMELHHRSNTATNE